MDQQLLKKCKDALRITTEACDDEINTLISAAKADIARVGVLSSAVSTPDDYITTAIIIYVKANFGFNNPDYDRLSSAYNAMLVNLSLSKKYTVAVPTVTV